MILFGFSAAHSVMDQFLRKLHETRRVARKDAPDFLRPPRPDVPRLRMCEMSTERSKGSADILKQESSFLLPKISKSRVHIRPKGSQTERSPHNDTLLQRRATEKRLTSRRNSLSVSVEPGTSFASFLSPIIDTPANALNSDMPEHKFYSLKAVVDEIFFHREPGEEDLQVQVSLGLDGLIYLTKLMRKTHEYRIQVTDDPFLFQPHGSPVGTLMMVKVLGSRPRGEIQELGMTLVDLSTIPVGGSTIQIACQLSDNLDRHTPLEVTLRLKIFARRKSFTFSYLKSDPVFIKAGYEVTGYGLCGFPKPYKKAGLPDGVKFSSLVLSHKTEDVVGLEVYKAHDANGNRFQVQKYNIMDKACRELLVAELDGLTDMENGMAIVLCDAFLENMMVCVVLDLDGGVLLRDAIAERGALPEMVASIVLRQLLQVVLSMHETKSRLHNDIDARNVLCLRTGEVRIGGFKYSMKVMGKASRFSGPFVHMSPERLLGLECSFPSDIWSLGLLAIELALGRCAYDLARFASPSALFEFKQAAVTDPSPSLKGFPNCSDELRSFVDQCLHKNMRARATPSELLDHPFIFKYESFMLPAGSWLTKKQCSSPTGMHSTGLGVCASADGGHG